MTNSGLEIRRTGDSMMSRARSFFAVELPVHGRQPKTLEFVLASIVAISGSVTARILIVTVAAHWFPVAAKYPPFPHLDYMVSTIAVVAVACAAWPASTLISSRGSRLFFALVAVVMLTFFTVDIAAIKADGLVMTGVIVAIHVVVAAVVYPSLVLLSPQWPPSRPTPRYDWDGPRWD